MVHMAAPKIQLCNMVAVKVNGMQKMAMVRSATARLRRNALRSVRDRRPTDRTTMTVTLPVTARSVVVVYSAISTDWYSSDRPGSFLSVAESFETTAGVVSLPAEVAMGHDRRPMSLNAELRITRRRSSPLHVSHSRPISSIGSML